MAQDLGDAALISRAMLALAEALIEMGDAQNALRIATEAQERFARAGQLESGWRSLLICARANDKIKDTAAADDHRSRAKEMLAQLEALWGSDAYKQYMNRPDIQLYYQQLGP